MNYTEFRIWSFKKPFKFVGSSLADLRNFPRETTREAGYQLNQVQLGFEPSDWKPRKSVGPGVREIRIHKDGEYRVIYIAKLHETVYVLHTFQKKSQKTPRKDIELTRGRLKFVLEEQT